MINVCVCVCACECWIFGGAKPKARRAVKLLTRERDAGGLHSGDQQQPTGALFSRLCLSCQSLSFHLITPTGAGGWSVRHRAGSSSGDDDVTLRLFILFV